MFTFALAAAAFYLATFFHELGHAAAAHIAGLRCMSFSIWPICVRRSHEKWVFVRPHLSVLEATGFVQVVPRHARGLRARVMCAVSGGPAVSIFIGAMAAGIANSRIAGTHGALSVFVWSLSLWSAFIGLSALIPLTSGRMATDGKTILDLWLGARGVLRTYAVVGLLDSASHMHPRHWDAGLVALATDTSVELLTSENNLTTLRLSENAMTPSQRTLETAVQRLRCQWGFATSNAKEVVRALEWLRRHQEPGIRPVRQLNRS